jgi:hypothetical protein
MIFLFGGVYDISKKFRASALMLRYVEDDVSIVFWYVTFVIAIREGGEGETGDGWFVNKSTM